MRKEQKHFTAQEDVAELRRQLKVAEDALVEIEAMCGCIAATKAHNALIKILKLKGGAK